MGYRYVDANLKQEIFAQGHPEKVLKLHFHGPIIIQDLNEDGTTWIEKWIGQFQQIIVPGYGVVYGRAGNVTVKYTCGEEDCEVEVLKDAGLRLYDPEGIEAVCDYLRP
jgi:hypothetical protein